MTRPRLLDLFCGAGGAGMGYHRAGFDVVGVDNQPQPRYPFEFHQADALAYVADHGDEFDIIHASPPCQRYSASTGDKYRKDHPDLYAPTRIMLCGSGKNWVIENVVGAPYGWGVQLCGTAFGLPMWRHRNFESSLLLWAPSCNHSAQPTIYSVTGNGYGGKHRGHNGTKPDGIDHARRVMGVDWPMTIAELSNAIPPAYTEFIGRQLLAALGHGVAP